MSRARPPKRSPKRPRKRKRSLIATRRRPSPTPHDHLFRFVFSKPQHVRGLLRRVLPAALVRRFDLASLRLEPGNYVDPRLSRSASDVLLSLRLRGSNQRALVYLLLEHQRDADPMMPFRFLKYACRAWDDYTERTDALPHHLPPLVPILIYQGPHPWRSPRSLSELHAIDGVASALPPAIELHMQLHELHADDMLSARELTTLARAALYLMKLVAAGELCPDDAALVARWFSLVRVHYGPDALEALVQYILQTDKSGTMIDAIAHEATHEVRETITTVADRLEARGHERGKIEGKIEGKLEGKLEGKIEGKTELVLEQLALRFGTLPARITRRVRKGTADDLRRWATRLLTAPALADVFSDP